MTASVFSSGRVRMALAVLFALIAGIAPGRGAEPRLSVLTSLFPQYDFARIIAGDRATVHMLLPPGAESHSFEPTPSDMKAIAGADLLIYTGERMEPWIKRLSAAAASGKTRLVDASRGIALRRSEEIHDDHDHDRDHEEPAEEHDEDEAGGDEHGHFHEFDPHVWLDPTLAMTMVGNIAAAFAEADPAGADLYRKNADRLLAELAELDEGFRRTVAAAPRRELVFGERFAFAYFFSRYGLEEIGPYKSCAPGAEPGLKAVIETVAYIRDNRVAYIYREAMSRGRITEVLRQETGVEALAVDSMHTLSADKMRSGIGYVEIMRANMDAFAKGLQ